jgi:hypothetical protein
MRKAASVTDSSLDATDSSPDRVSETARPADVRTQGAAYDTQQQPGHEPMGNGLVTASRACKDRGMRG